MDIALAHFGPHSLDPSAESGPATAIAGDLAYLRVGIVNVFFAGAPESGDRGWVLVDAGLHGSAGRIRRAAERYFGEGRRPSAIVLTHGHFDHVGALETLAREWDCVIFAHRRELPYLTGESAYPPFDPTVGGGSMARLSPLYPRGPVDVSDRVRALPDDGRIPGMPGWRWIHTPGHTPGHVALFRDADRSLIAGDAVVTTRQESMLATMTQRLGIHGPPAYATPDWGSAQQSVHTLAGLEPRLLAAGHGRPLAGSAVAQGLSLLARDFATFAVPEQGRYVNEPAVFDANGRVVSVPPAVRDDFTRVAMAAGLALVAGVATYALLRHHESRRREADARDSHIDLEAALLAGDEEYALGSAFEAEQHVPIAVADERTRRYGTRYGERHRIHPEEIQVDAGGP